MFFPAWKFCATVFYLWNCSMFWDKTTMTTTTMMMLLMMMMMMTRMRMKLSLVDWWNVSFSTNIILWWTRNAALALSITSWSVIQRNVRLISQCGLLRWRRRRRDFALTARSIAALWASKG